jgi:spore germination cell wall hydrolase CwlJ-like protein
MQKKTQDALRRADKILVSAFCLSLLMIGAAVAYVPYTDDAKPTVAPMALQMDAQPRATTFETPAIAVDTAPAATSLSREELIAMKLLAQSDCLAEAMYYEARGEGKAGQMAVAEVVYHRMRYGNYPSSICGVVFEGSHLRTGCQFSFTCNGDMNRPKNATAWRRARVLALRIVTGVLPLGDLTGDATSFHATDVQPGWAGDMERTVQIGNHIFYRPARHAITRGA